MKATFDYLCKRYGFTRKGEYLSHDDSFPYSISEKEFNYITKFIIDKDLKSGYDLATGVGIAALGSGLGFKKTGGKLISVDSYIEHERQSDSYEGDTAVIFQSASYAMNRLLMYDYKVPVALEEGWSPFDVLPIFRENNVTMLDYVFIDGGHYPKQVRKDIAILKDKVNGYMFFHDVNNERLLDAISKQVKITFNSYIDIVLPNLGLAII